MDPTTTGIIWTMLAAVFLGTFALPSKYIKNYAWENTWGAFFLMGMFVVPLGFALAMVNGLWGTYSEISGSVIFGVVSLGFLWGCGFCCWGYGLSMVGLSLGYSLTMGTMALVGSMVPFFLGSADKAATLGGAVVIGGIFVCIVGVGINGYAGLQRERSQAADETGSEAEGEIAGEPKKKTMLLGLVVCVMAGLLSSGLNIAFHLGKEIGEISEQQFGNAPWVAGLSTWTLIFVGGGISSCSFTLILLCKNKSWNSFGNEGAGRNLTFAAVMAIGHFLCIFIYGIGTWKLGDLGTSVGFSIFQSGSLLIGNGLGLATGEWSGSSRESKCWLLSGLVVLVLGIVTVSVGNALSA